MKRISKKALLGIIAAGLFASSLSVSVFAEKVFESVNYSLRAEETSGPILYLADDTYMYFNTRPASGAGGVNLSVSGPGVSSSDNHFPFQVSRSPLRINTSQGIGNYYTVYLSAGSTDVSGVLSAWTSSN